VQIKRARAMQQSLRAPKARQLKTNWQSPIHSGLTRTTRRSRSAERTWMLRVFPFGRSKT